MRINYHSDRIAGGGAGSFKDLPEGSQVDIREAAAETHVEEAVHTSVTGINLLPREAGRMLPVESYV